jgi:hypothetical protein
MERLKDTGKPSVLISIDAIGDTESVRFGREFIDGLIQEDERLRPEYVSMDERFRDPFIDTDHFIANWWAMPVKSYLDGRLEFEYFKGPLWKRKHPLASQGMVSHGLVDIKGRKTSSTLWLECRWDRSVDFLHLFEKWVALARPAIGMLHLFTDAERQTLSDEAGASFSVGSFGGPAKPGLPDIGWAMAYGPDYAGDVDVARIAEAGFEISEIGGAQVVQVTDRLTDVVDNYAFFARRRAELKSLFRPDLFWIE